MTSPREWEYRDWMDDEPAVEPEPRFDTLAERDLWVGDDE